MGIIRRSRGDVEGCVVAGGTDTTVANIDTVFAGTVASGLTGITSSGWRI